MGFVQYLYPGVHDFAKAHLFSLSRFENPTTYKWGILRGQLRCAGSLGDAAWNPTLKVTAKREGSAIHNKRMRLCGLIVDHEPPRSGGVGWNGLVI